MAIVDVANHLNQGGANILECIQLFFLHFTNIEGHDEDLEAGTIMRFSKQNGKIHKKFYFPLRLNEKQ